MNAGFNPVQQSYEKQLSFGKLKRDPARPDTGGYISKSDDFSHSEIVGNTVYGFRGPKAANDGVFSRVIKAIINALT